MNRFFARVTILTTFLAIQSSLFIWAQSPHKTEYTDFEKDTLQLQQVEVLTSRGNRLHAQHLTSNTEMIGQQQLVRAACCNLGESFTTNPSVDVNYSDAATGARQIKLLGLSGTYVQMLTENVPNLRGAAIPFGLGYIPGPWMQSIQVSKGASSVRNGYESTTGQINIEYLKPQGVDGVSGNVYYDAQQKLEANVMAGIHCTSKFSNSLLLHFEDRQKDHDGNGDGFMDMPKQRQYNGMYRWAYVSPRLISQFYVKAIREERKSGQSQHQMASSMANLYTIGINTNRYELQWKNALILDTEHNTSVALMLQGSWHDADTHFGLRQYDVLQKNGYAQLMYETDFTPEHNLSVGASLNHDYFDQNSVSSHETTSGLYAQYTYKHGDLLSIIAGLRYDYSSLYNGFWTPRMHIKLSPTDWLTMRASVGKGYRTPHALAENISYLASGRDIFTLDSYEQEEAWNSGLSLGFTIPMGGRDLELNAEYYYTDFKHQLVVNPYSDASAILFQNLDGKSFSHTMQVDASYTLFEGLDALAGFRFSDSRTDYDGHREWRPLTPRYKGMLSFNYKTPLEFWQFDLTGQLIGPSELYDGSHSPVYGQLSAQITREFHYFAIYLGGENLTGYKMDHPILYADQPWSQKFDATQVWGPTEGAMVYLGIRFKIEKN